MAPKTRKGETFKLVRQNGRLELGLAGLASFKLKLEADAGGKAPVARVKQEVIFTINKLDIFLCDFLVLTYIFRALECVLVFFVQMSKSAPQTNQYRLSVRLAQPRSYCEAHPLCI